MRIFFESCRKCVAPKRHPGCQDHCPDYAKDKKVYDEWKAAEDKRRKTQNEIFTQKTDGIMKAVRKRRQK